MLSLRPYRDKRQGLPDLLNWGSLIDNGVILNKDGSLQAGWFYQGEDLDSSPPERLNWVSEHVNAALARLTGGWAIWTDAVRLPAPRYFPAHASKFPDRVSALVDEERRRQFMSGRHYETEYVLSIQYTPPLRSKGRLADIIYDDDGQGRAPADEILAAFQRSLASMEDALSGAVSMSRMLDYDDFDVAGQPQRRSALVNYLHFCLTGEEVQLNLPPSGGYLDTIIGGKEFYPGETPLVGDKYAAVIRITGYPATSVPGLLSVMDVLPIPLRYSSRFIAIDTPEARKQIVSIERKWKQRVRGFWADVLKRPSPRVDQDALDMADQAGEALARTNSGLVGTGC